MPLVFPSASRGQTYQSGSSATYRWNGSFWETITTPASMTLNAVQVSSSISASYAVSASYILPQSDGQQNKNIESISQTGYSFTLMLAEGKIYAIKSSDGGYSGWPQALFPTSRVTGLFRGLQNAYEIGIPNETGRIVSASAYGNSAYALFDNGDLYTWGNNDYGQLGIGSTVVTYYPTQSNSNVTRVFTHASNGSGDPSYTRLLIQKTDGKVYGCGYNEHRELGLNTTTNQQSWVELPWAGTNPLSVWNLGSYRGNTFVQKSDGTVWGAGYNNYGQIGNNGTSLGQQAVQVDAWLGGDSSNRIIEICAGHRVIEVGTADTYTNTMLLSNGSTTSIRSAGYNGTGGIGDGTLTFRQIPVAPTGTWSAVKRIAGTSCGYSSRYVVRNDGTLWVWGYNGFGQLGTGGTEVRQTPIQITIPGQTIEDIVPITQGVLANGHAMTSPLIKTTTGYYMSGYNVHGQLGAGVTATTSNFYRRVKLPPNVIIKFVGNTTTLNEGITYYAVDTNNRIWSWGYNGDLTIDTYSNSHQYFQPVNIQPTVLRK